MIAIVGSLTQGVIMHRGKPVGYVEDYRVYIEGALIGECSNYNEAMQLIKKELYK